jgi:DnaJ family protein C protein 28
VTKRLESLTEKSIREAIEKGEFNNLPGKGKPLDLSENPFEDPDLRTVHRLLRNAGFAPAWIEERKDIEGQLELARTTLTRAWRLYGPHGKASNSDAWERNVAEFRAQVAKLRQRVQIYNLKAPATIFHKRQLDAEALIEEIKNSGATDDRGSER